ncbi:MAG: FkbM family methyltransferase [Acidobacteriota bacterium]
MTSTISIDKIRHGVKSAVRSLGYDIRQVDSYVNLRPADFIRSRNIDVVVDVGANVGQYAEQLRHDGYTGWIVSAEPVRATYDALASRAAADSRWRTMNLAFGEQAGIAQINVSQMSEFSSCLTQLPAAQAFVPEARVLRQESITVARLDDAFAEFPAGRAYLKIDTQGFEEQVLKGGAACLSNFLGIQMELSVVHLYEGTWRFHEAVAYMVERGFEISNILPVNFDPADQVSLLEVDCIFRRRAA